MKRFHLETIEVRDYRGLGSVQTGLESDLTVIFGPNGAGKTAVLAAIATGLGRLTTDPRGLADFRPERDLSRSTHGRSDECRIAWRASTPGGEDVHWSAKGDRHGIEVDDGAVLEALGLVAPGLAGAPVIAWYGEGRRGPVYRWWTDRTPKQRNAIASTGALVAPGVRRSWYSESLNVPMAELQHGGVATWDELSPGQSQMLWIGADLARHAEQRTNDAALRELTGLVLIDAIDRNLDPAREREVLGKLTGTFPGLQMVVTTRSPQVLSSVDNRQVRQMGDGAIRARPLVQGRDTNSILREHMNTTDRDPKGEQRLRVLHDTIDRGEYEAGRDLYNRMLVDWGGVDTTLIRARGYLDDIAPKNRRGEMQ